MSVASVVAAVGLNLGLMADRTPTTGPGTFEPVVAELPTTTSTAPAATETSAGERSVPSAGSSLPGSVTVDRDDVSREDGSEAGNGRPSASDDTSAGDDQDSHDPGSGDSHGASDHELGHDDDD